MKIPLRGKALSRIQTRDRKRLQDAIRALADDPRSRQSKKLRGRDGWRLRKGTYRVVYEIDEANKEVTVLDVGHRRDVYR